MNDERNCDLCEDYQFSPENFKDFLWSSNLVLYEDFIILDKLCKNDRPFLKDCVVCVNCEEELPTIKCSICKNGKLKPNDLSEDYLDYEEIRSWESGFDVDGIFCINCYRLLGWKER